MSLIVGIALCTIFKAALNLHNVVYIICIKSILFSILEFSIAVYPNTRDETGKGVLNQNLSSVGELMGAGCESGRNCRS